jgi:hypothetical protein
MCGKETISLGSHDLFLGEVVALHVKEEVQKSGETTDWGYSDPEAEKEKPAAYSYVIRGPSKIGTVSSRFHFDLAGCSLAMEFNARILDPDSDEFKEKAKQLAQVVDVTLLFREPNPKVEVLNGSGVAGAAKKVADQLAEAGYEVTRTVNAPKSDYYQSQVITRKAFLKQP